MIPVDKPDGLFVLTDFGCYTDTVPQQGIDLFVIVVKGPALVSRSIFQLPDGFCDQSVVVFLFFFEK